MEPDDRHTKTKVEIIMAGNIRLLYERVNRVLSDIQDDGGTIKDVKFGGSSWWYLKAYIIYK
jgi:hypothetical protein